MVINVEPENVFGIVPLEAASFSTPVIVCKNNYISNFIEKGRFGISVKYGHVSDLAQAIDKIIHCDELRNEMGLRGKDFVAKYFSWDRLVTEVEAVYNAVIYKK